MFEVVFFSTKKYILFIYYTYYNLQSKKHAGIENERTDEPNRVDYPANVATLARFAMVAPLHFTELDKCTSSH